MAAKKIKEKKPQIFYQLVNVDGIPFSANISSWYDSEITTGNNSNVHCNQGTVVRHVKNLLYELGQDQIINQYDDDEPMQYFIDGVAITKDEMISYLLNSKIQVLRPAEKLDLTFYLDKIK